MSRIRMYVHIDNQSDATLAFKRDEIVSGDYTPDWRPPASIGAGEKKTFEAEGDLTLVATTGTEGRVWYDIITPSGSAGELYIHWNSPLVESAYDNTFHIWGPPNWEVTHSGGQGHHANLEIRLRRTARRAVPNFHAAGRGFRFPNSWSHDLPVITVGFLWNRLFESLPGPLGDLGIEKLVDENWLPLTRANTGMCGGMVFAVMDYHAARQLPPDQTAPPDSRDDELYQFIRDRLWDSFDVGGQGHRWLGYSSPHYPNGDEGVFQAIGLTRGRAWITYREAWPQIQADIDAGRPSPVGLVQTVLLDIAQNHQVLAYAYEKSGQDVILFVYDPNVMEEGFPREVALSFNVTHTTGEVVVRRTPSKLSDPRIWCFFRIDGYSPKGPPRGRHISSVRDALRASQSPPFSLLSALRGSASRGSVRAWLRSV